jgi:hypothetical protein
MWKPSGYILYKGHYPISAKYLVYNENTNKISWSVESNDATIFPEMEDIKEVFPECNNREYKFRICIMTDEPVN